MGGIPGALSRESFDSFMEKAESLQLALPADARDGKMRKRVMIETVLLQASRPFYVAGDAAGSHNERGLFSAAAIGRPPHCVGEPESSAAVVARALRGCVYVNAGHCNGSRQHGSSRDAALRPSAKDRRQHHRLAVPAAQAVVRRARPARGRRRQHPLPWRSPVVNRARSQVRCGAGVLRVADELPRAAGAFA